MEWDQKFKYKSFMWIWFLKFIFALVLQWKSVDFDDHLLNFTDSLQTPLPLCPPVAHLHTDFIYSNADFISTKAMLFFLEK